MDDTLVSSNQVVYFDQEVTTALFQLTGKEEGIHIISFEISGASKEDYQIPNPLILLVKNNTDIDNSIVTVLPSGCCEYITPYNCTTEQSISLTSSCDWQNLHSSLVTGGMIYLHANDLQLPISIAGLNMTLVDQSVHSSLPSSLSTCDSCTDACNSQIPSFDVLLQSLMGNTFQQAFVDNCSHLIPELYSLSLESFVDSSNIFYSQTNFINFFGTGQDLIDQEICNDLSIVKDEFYAAIVIDRPFSLSYGNTVYYYIPIEKLCIAIELCDSPARHVSINIPTGLSNSFKESLFQNVSTITCA